MPNLIWISAIGVGVLAFWPAALLIRRWWLKPYQNPKRILRRIQRSLRLTHSEVQHVNTLLGKDLDPLAACQFLLDPCRWPIAAQDESTKKLYAKVFNTTAQH